ncbi:MAG TPA: phosphate/phosphite/phosphonate ABC transporter substrate-binding protein [Candidatus Angelobacter sp.]|jgi:phosphonate transport system substrate-binding protein|nr:phosphate/phosphite/phosphonate ABC transporter substrate-binding protein [Candidatus Angelobacter sp.]
MILRTRTALFALVCIFALVSLSAAQKPIVVAIAADGLSAPERAPLQSYLTKQMGREVKLVILNNYNEYIAGLGDGSIDFSVLGAVNYCRARHKHAVIPLVQRTDDLQFHAVFVTSSNSINSLKDMKGKQVAFVDPYSASGYVIPALEMKNAGIMPTEVSRHFTGGHPNVAKLVESGVVEAGALDETVYKSMLDKGTIDRSKIRIFYTSKPFVDWVYVGRKDLPEAERQRFVKAMENLTPGRDDQILKILRAHRFVPAKDDEYATIRQICIDLKLLE